MVYVLSTVISVRIPKQLKEEMDKLKDMVNWSEEIRRFLERKVREYKKKLILKEVDTLLNSLPPASPGESARLVREDRDSR